MESRKLAAILSSLVSQLLLLLLHNIFPFPPNNSILPLLLFSHQLAATLSPEPHKFLQRKRKRKRQRHFQLPNPLTRTPDSFRNTFLMSSSSFQWLSGLLDPLLECRDPAALFHSLNLSSGARLAIGLSRLAEGSDYPQISSRFSVSVPVAKFCVKQLCRVLCTNFRFWVSFPSPSDLPSVSQSFQTLSGLPNCCGSILCSRFNILVNANIPNNKVSISQVAAQIVVDSSSRILTIVAGFLGHKSDSQILHASSLYNDIQQGTLLNAPNAPFNQYLIGDSQYPLLPWLMVPYTNPAPGSAEENFNSAHQIMRLAALRASASLRNWGVLRKPVTEELKMAVAYIGACSILHNSLLMREDFSALASEFEDCNQGFCNAAAFEGEAVSSVALALRDNLANMAKEFCRDSKNS
ncbi:Protein ALP1-like [Glycine soja]|uniref:Protein ALP1-like n=2 Tax=Glycine soja TaxID=3848 RepID=A0A445LMM8_GLYSO|nr:Protein ALP1-like [Glycine soja]